MPSDLTVIVHDRPGAVAEVADALGSAGINIEGGCCLAVEGRGTLHLLVADPAAAREALRPAGIDVAGEQEVLVLDVEDRPGALAEVTRAAADAGVNLTTLYLATATRLVLGADDLDGLRRAL